MVDCAYNGQLRIDDTGFGGIKVIQRPDFGYGVDSVLLAAFAAGETGAKALKTGSKVADLGTGCGIIAFVIAHKISSVSVTGIEKSEDAFNRACEACRLNGMSDRVSFVNCDINEIAGKHDHDAIITNPPYFRRMAASDRDKSDDRYIARHETTADIGGFVKAASSMLRKGGSFYLVHRPDRLADIISEMRFYGVEPKELQMVVPSKGKAANIVLIHGIKDAGPELRVLPEIAVHNDDGSYTDQIMSIYERV